MELWNFPHYWPMCALASNLVANNPVIAEYTNIVSHCTETFAHLVREVDTPEGMRTDLFISQEQVTKIITDDHIQGVALTGSERAGSVVAAQAAEYIKKSTLELGDSDVFVILSDVDLERAVRIGVRA